MMQKSELDHAIQFNQMDQQAVEDKVLDEKLLILQKNLLISLPSNFLCATIVFIAFYNTSYSHQVFIWYIAVILVSLFRLATYYYYIQEPVYLKRHMTFFVAGVILSAILWAIVATALHPSDHLVLQMITLVIIAGITAGGIQTLQANLNASLSYIIIIILPLCVWMLLQGEQAYLILGLAMIIYLLYMVVAAIRGYKLLDKALRLGFENVSLIEHLSQSHDELQVTYQSVKKNEELLKNIQDNAPIGMALVSLDGQWLQVNNALCHLVGYSKSELEGMTFQEITFPDDLAHDLFYVKQLREGKISSYQMEKRYIHKSGQIIWILLSATMLHDDHNQPLCFIAQILNINERKEQEKQTHQLNETLLSTLDQLKQREYSERLINKMNDQLQLCYYSSEAYPRIKLIIQDLFPDLNGALSIYNTSTKNMETVSQWGHDHLIQQTFLPTDCFGVREGTVNIVDEPKEMIPCYHYLSSPKGSYMCLPLIVQNDLIGAIFFYASNGKHIQKSQQTLIVSFSNVIKLALANIRLREILHEQSTHDPLTGLFNRRYLEEQFARELLRMTKNNSTLCVAMFDLDFFKRFNDENGHEAGDFVLQTIAKLLQQFCQPDDIACRYGGEEFIMVLVNTNLTDAVVRLEQIREGLKKERLYFNDHLLPQITVSIGVAEAPTQGKTPRELLNLADQALYRAKQTGRDRIEVYH